MAVRIPFVPSIANYSFSTTLDSQRFEFIVRWNEFDQGWYFDLLDEHEGVIVAGAKIVLGTILMSGSTDPRMPPGMFIVLDSTRSGLDANFEDLGTRVTVIYFSADELGLAAS